jgi:hypothetical protein
VQIDQLKECFKENYGHASLSHAPSLPLKKGEYVWMENVYCLLPISVWFSIVLFNWF